MLQSEGSNAIGKRHLAKRAVHTGVSKRHGEIERLEGIPRRTGHGLGDRKIAVCGRPFAIQRRIHIQRRAIAIPQRTLFVRVPAVKGISLMGALLVFGRIRRANADIIIRRGRHIGRVIRADPLIMNTNGRHIGHPIGLSRRLALANDQSLRHLPARGKNAVCIRLRRCIHAACVIRIINKLCANFRPFNRAVFAVNLDRLCSACARIRGNYIDIATFFGDGAAFFQVDVVICADHGIISQIECRTNINAVAFGRTSVFFGKGVVIVLDDASGHCIGSTKDTAACVCSIVFNGAACLLNGRARPQTDAAARRGFVFGNLAFGNCYIRSSIQEDTTAIILGAVFGNLTALDVYHTITKECGNRAAAAFCNLISGNRAAVDIDGNFFPFLRIGEHASAVVKSRVPRNCSTVHFKRSGCRFK